MVHVSVPIEIRPLADHPEAIPTLAEWFSQEWNDYDKRTRLEIEEQLRQNLGRDSVPITFVAIQNSQIIGTVSLDLSDLPPYDHLFSPWVASLYVPPAFRRRGVGRSLVSHVIDYARSKRLPRIYLWTPGSPGFYEKCGWRVLLATTYSSRPITVLQFAA